MQIVVSKDVLIPLLSRCASVADKKSTMPVLAKCLLTANGTLACAATDLFQSVTGAVAAEVKEEGSVAVSARDLLERVKMLSGNISLTTKGTDIVIKSGSRRFTMHGIPGEEFPQLPQNDAAPLMTLPAETLGKLIAYVIFAVSTDETRLHLNAALFECEGDKLRLVATDGHRLSLVEAPAPDGANSFSMLVPLKGLLEIRRLVEVGGTVEVAQNGGNLFLRVGGFDYSIRTADSVFPPWRQVIPGDNSMTATVERTALADATRAVSVAASDKGLIRLSFSAGKLRVESDSPDTGDGFDEVAIECDGSVTIGMNGKYLLDSLGAIDSAKVSIKLNGDLDPMVIVPVAESDWFSKQLIMPART